MIFFRNDEDKYEVKGRNEYTTHTHTHTNRVSTPKIAPIGKIEDAKQVKGKRRARNE